MYRNNPHVPWQGVRQPVTSSPSIRLYKYSVYDGKVGAAVDVGVGALGGQDHF
jgi:hypothetical protein